MGTTLSNGTTPGYRRPGGSSASPREGASASSSTSSSAVTWNGTRADPDDEGLDAELVPVDRLLPHLLDGPDEAPVPPLVEGHAVEHARRRRRAQPLEAPREVALVLAAERVEPERAPAPSPGRARCASQARSSTSSALAVRRRASTTQHVFQPSATSTATSEQPVALAADEHRRARPLAPPAGRSPRRRPRW